MTVSASGSWPSGFYQTSSPASNNYKLWTKYKEQPSEGTGEGQKRKDMGGSTLRERKCPRVSFLFLQLLVRGQAPVCTVVAESLIENLVLLT